MGIVAGLGYVIASLPAGPVPLDAEDEDVSPGMGLLWLVGIGVIVAPFMIAKRLYDLRKLGRLEGYVRAGA